MDWKPPFGWILDNDGFNIDISNMFKAIIGYYIVHSYRSTMVISGLYMVNHG